MVSVDLLTFETLSFDEKEGGYRCQINETDYVIIGINDGKVSFLKKFWIENQGGEIAEDTAVYVLSYGDAYVGDLPPVENVIDGENEGVVNPTYPTNSDNGETDNGEEAPENDKVIIINNQYGY